MTVLVTGAAGFLGSHITDMLVERGESVRVLVRPAEDVTRLAQAGVEIYRGDLKDASSLVQAVEGVKEVIHCAAKMGPWGPESEYEQVNVLGPKILLERALTAGVKKFVHLSSIDVHGLAVGDGVDETAPYGNETDPYCRSKIAGERLLQQMIQEQNAPVIVIRPGLIYGPRDTHSFARFVRLIEQGKMPILGSGTNQLPLIYVSDVVQGVMQARETEQSLGRTYLLVNDEPTPQRDYFYAIAKELGVSPPRFQIPYQLALTLGSTVETAYRLAGTRKAPPLMRFGLKQMGGENHFVISRARQELGFEPQVSFVEGVRKGIAWYRKYKAQKSARYDEQVKEQSN